MKKNKMRMPDDKSQNPERKRKYPGGWQRADLYGYTKKEQESTADRIERLKEKSLTSFLEKATRNDNSANLTSHFAKIITSIVKSEQHRLIIRGTSGHEDVFEELFKSNLFTEEEKNFIIFSINKGYKSLEEFRKDFEKARQDIEGEDA
jgi:superoxide dismutase